MVSIDYELELGDEERSVQETLHKFAQEVTRPAGAELDAMADRKDVIAEGSILWEVFEKHRALGLDEVLRMEADGTIDICSSITHRLTLEEVPEALEILRTKRGDPERIVIEMEGSTK